MSERSERPGGEDGTGLVPLYVLLLCVGVGIVSFSLGRKSVTAEREVVFIPRSHEEAEAFTTPSEALKGFM